MPETFTPRRGPHESSRFIALFAALIVSFLSTAANAVPVLFYSDLDSGPVGAFVTIWGKDFGSTGSVTVGTTPAQIVSWSENKVELKVQPESGNGLTLSTAGQSSNQLPFATRSGRIFFVSSLDGNDDNNGRAEETPWKTLAPVLGAVSPGDVVYVKSGTYDAISNSTYGTNFFVRRPNSGSPGNPIALVGYPGESPIIGTTGAGGARRAILIESGVTDWTIAKLSVKANGAGIEIGQGGGADRIRIIGNEASGIPSGTGTFAINACSNTKIYGNHVYNSGQPGNKLAHLIYYEGFGVGSNVEIAWNLLHDELGGRCIQVYGHLDSDRLSGLSIHDNIVYNCPYDGILVGSSDASFKGWISDALVYNNVVYNAGNAGIRLDNPAVDARVFHNTLYGNGSAIRIQNAKSAELRNNILAQTGNGTYVSIESVGTLAMSHNGYSGGNSSTRPAQDTNPITATDPLFTNAAGADFSLQTGSPFRDVGTTISPALPTVSVPSDPSPDLGALGWVQQVVAPVAPSVPSKPGRPTATLH